MNRKTILIGLCIILILVCVTNTATATWCDNNYGKKRPILINNTCGSAQTYYQVMLNYTFDSDMNNNFSDARVYNESDCSLVPLWNESAVDGSWNKIWFNATNISGSCWTNDTYYFYYDYASASSVSNITNTFLFGDDFEDNTLDKWTVSGAEFTASSNKMYAYADAGDTAQYSALFSDVKVIELDYDWVSYTTTSEWIKFRMSNNSGFSAPVANFQFGRWSGHVSPYPGNIDGYGDNNFDAHLKFVLDNNEVHWYKDGVLQTINSLDGNDHEEYVGTEFKYFRVEVEIGAGQYKEFYIDNVRGRKYILPEPTAQLGTEESQPPSGPTLNIGNAINIAHDWGRDWNSNFSANVTSENASDVWMNFTNAEFTNTSLGDLNLTLNEWVNQSHNVAVPVTNISVTVTLNSTTSGTTNDTDTFWYEITNRTNTATMDSSAAQSVYTNEDFYINATCNEEYGDTFYGSANLLEDGTIIDTDASVTNYVNFSHNESTIGVYNYTVRFYNLTYYDNATTPTFSNVTVSNLSTTPSISGEYPTSPVQNDTSESTVTFGATINQTSNNQWIADFGAGNITLEWDNSTSSPAYTNTTFNQTTGDNSYTIYLKAFNSTNSSFNSSTLWVWNITDVTPPASVTGLTNSTYAITYINWTWTNPIDSDFNHTMVFINESFEINVTTPFYNDTGLLASTQYNISTRTVDASGNINQTWVNATSTTASEAPPTFIPPDPTNLANTTGNFWCNFTWDPSAGNITNSYNVTINGTGYNGSSNTYYNNSVPAHGWSNITVSAWNSSGSGTLSSGSISDNVQIPNNEPSLSGLPDNSTNEDVNQSDIFDLDDYFTDVDGDNPTFDVESNNQSANVNVSIDGENKVDYTLTLNWYGVASVVINVSDGWGGYDNDTFLIIVSAVNDAPITSNLQTEGQTNPVDITDYTPDFTWTYSDPVEGDVQSHWQIYVGTSSGLSDKWDSGELVGADTADVYAGSVLVNGTTYYVQVRTKDSTNWSSWETGTFKILSTTFNITIYKGYNLIGYLGTVNSSAEVVVSDIDYTNYITVLEKSTTDYFRTHTKGFSINNFTAEHGYGYYLFATTESIYERNNIASFSFNTTLKEGWNIIGRTNSTGINAEQLSNSVGSNCSYVADLNPNGEITIHTKGFNSNNFNIVKGRAFFVHVNKDMRWGRDA